MSYVERLAEIVRKYEPGAEVLQEVRCCQCGGVGIAYLNGSGAGCCGARGGLIHLHRCYYCGGKGAGYSEDYAKYASGGAE